MSKLMGALALGLFVAVLGSMSSDVAAQSAPCFGCTVGTGVAGNAFAPEPCLGSKGVPAHWEIGIVVAMGDGSCDYAPGVDGKPGKCVETPCGTSVDYSWGKFVAGSVGKIGYHGTTGKQRPYTELTFPDGPPWKEGEFGAVSFDSGNSPQVGCGNAVTFFIEGNMCGPFKATAEAGCGNCYASAGSHL